MGQGQRTWSKLHVYDVESGKKVRVLTTGRDDSARIVNSFAVSHNRAAVGNVNGTVWLLDLKSGKVLESIKNREDEEIECMAFSSDGQWLAYFVDGVFHVVKMADHNMPQGLAQGF